MFYKKPQSIKFSNHIPASSLFPLSEGQGIVLRKSTDSPFPSSNPTFLYRSPSWPWSSHTRPRGRQECWLRSQVWGDSLNPTPGPRRPQKLLHGNDTEGKGAPGRGPHPLPQSQQPLAPWTAQLHVLCPGLHRQQPRTDQPQAPRPPSPHTPPGGPQSCSHQHQPPLPTVWLGHGRHGEAAADAGSSERGPKC